ncbi:MAG: hypothetical protein KDB22_18090 [Planctomycetales bacterium]|nr:hypothetical protein [Planctomycetales bacterium]
MIRGVAARRKPNWRQKLWQSRAGLACREFSARFANSRWCHSLVLSMLLHVLLLLVLAFIALRAADAKYGLTLNCLPLDPSSEFLLPDAVAFEPVIEQSEPLPTLSDQLDALQALELPEFQPLTSAALPGQELPSEPETASDATESAADVLQGVSAVAVSIQNRVSQAGGQRGEVQFALAWKNINDVDIHVITPRGDRISHLRPRSMDNGVLDVDMNVRGESELPIENVRWLSQAPSGRYTVLVHLFRIHEGRPGQYDRNSRFQLLAQLGSETILNTGVVSRHNQLEIYQFQYVPDNLPQPQRHAILDRLAELQGQEEAQARPLLEEAKVITSQERRDVRLNQLIFRYPHTSAAIEAMRLLGGHVTK